VLSYSGLAGVLCRVIASYVRLKYRHKFAEIANNRKRSRRRSYSLFSCPISTAGGTLELVRAGKAKLQGRFRFGHDQSLPREAKNC
jgi:hypothetical protein